MKKAFVIASALAAVPCANAQYSSGFESPDYAVGGLAGQDGWYVPSGIDFNVAAYGADPFGFAANPNGGEQFIIGRWDGDNARGQHDIDYGAGGVWTISYDVNNIYDQSDVATNNIGSASLQPSTTSKSFISLNRFPADASDVWDADFIYYTSDNVQTTASPGVEWQGLSFNRWYRQSTTIDFDTNEILEIAITDIVAGATTTFNPDGWYLNGGADSMMDIPTALRFFASGNAANITGWDNLSIVPAPGALALLGLGLVGATRRRR